MERKSSILVLGDPGPVRHDLLMRSDIETLWMSRADEIAAVLRHAKPDVCLISAELPQDHVDTALDLIAAAGPPCIVLIGVAGGHIGPHVTTRAAAIVPAQRTDSILALVGLHTGLVFARDARASFEALVRAYVGEEEYVLETSNISVSGVAIRYFPRVPTGTMVHVEIELPGATVVAEARVVRYGRDAHHPIGGLTFVRIARAQRERIMRIVEASRRDASAPDVRVEDLFADLTLDLGRAEALDSGDITDSGDLREHDLKAPAELASLASWIDNNGSPFELPDWIVRIAQELTPLERSALRREAGSEWVLPALEMRLVLARFRNAPIAEGADAAQLAADGKPKLPSPVADEAYRLFVRLGDVGIGATDAVVTQVARIRAALLRDLLAGGPKPRSGMLSRRFDDESGDLPQKRVAPADTLDRVLGVAAA